MTDKARPISDERLVAYLDGALRADARAEVEAAIAADDALAERLAALDVPMAQLRAVMAPDVLAAPQMPAKLMGRVPRAFTSAPDRHTPAASPRRRVWVPTLVAASFAAGMALTYVLTPAPPPAASPGWIDAVASYQALYVTASLEATEQSPEDTASVLADAAGDFGVTLDPALALEGLDFKRAQMLAWNGKPLLQMAYLAEDGTPLALCLTRVAAEDRGPRTAVSNDMAGVSWVQDGIGYVLIGGSDTGRVEALSEQVRARL